MFAGSICQARRCSVRSLLAGAARPQRGATPSERALLIALNFELPTGDLLTEVWSVTPSVVRRIWPKLAVVA